MSGETAKTEGLRKKLDTQGDYGSQLESQAAWVTLHLAFLCLN